MNRNLIFHDGWMLTNGMSLNVDKNVSGLGEEFN